MKETILKYGSDEKFIRRNALVWLIIYTAMLSFNWLLNGFSYNSAFLQITVATLFIVVIFYAHFILCAAYFQKHKRRFFIASLGLFFVYLLINYGFAVSDYKRVTDTNLYPKSTFLLLRAFSTSIYYLVIIAFSTVYWSLKKSGESESENEKIQATLKLKNVHLEQQKLVLERDLFQSENNFLRAQINPHFLYNCLNFLYAKTFQQQPKVADGIMLLSQIMRYSLTDFSGANGLAKLDEELVHIENVIRINRLRFEHSLQVQLKVEGQTAGKKIAPMLLITLVENIFKHGDLQDASFPATISCQVNAETKLLYFTTCNKTNKTTSADSSGLGIGNIRQRLQLLYKDNFTLDLIENDSRYKALLVIPYFDEM